MPYPRPDGSQAWAWTTFGEDQVDVDVRHPATLVELTDVLLGYLARGASAVRLDAIGFLWKESGTTCLHLPQTHAVIKLWRALADHVAPGARLLTETNVPHEENISYFGDGDDEAHLVYQFALPPLVLHSFVAGSTARLSDWAEGVGPVSSTATWFNFLASHDGIGLRATEGILDDDERSALVDRTRAHGGRVSMASRPDGTQRGLRAQPQLPRRAVHARRGRRPGRPRRQGPGRAQHPVRVPRRAGGLLPLARRLLARPRGHGDQPHQPPHQPRGPRRRPARSPSWPRTRAGARCSPACGDLLDVRRRHEAFSPFGTQQVEHLDDRVFAVRRGDGTADELLCVTNVTGETVLLPGVTGRDVLTDSDVAPLILGPWGYAWVRPDRR